MDARPLRRMTLDIRVITGGALSHDVFPTADSFPLHSSGVSLKDSQKLNSGNLKG